MAKLFNAFFFKLRKDLSFRITLFIGIGLAILLSLILLGVELIVNGSLGSSERLLTGETMLTNSLSPVANFGIAIPVNLITFTVLEFSQGTIRNKIIAGYSKFKIYVSLYLFGLIFSLALLSIYVGLCTAIGSIYGGFNPYGNGFTSIGSFTPTYLWRLVLTTFISYLFIVSFTVFFSTLFRQIGGAIPVVIVVLFFFYFVALIASSLTLGAEPDNQFKTVIDILKFVDPLFAPCASVAEFNGESITLVIDDLSLIGNIVSNLVYASIFFILGVFIFKKRDVK